MFSQPPLAPSCYTPMQRIYFFFKTSPLISPRGEEKTGEPNGELQNIGKIIQFSLPPSTPHHTPTHQVANLHLLIYLELTDKILLNAKFQNVRVYFGKICSMIPPGGQNHIWGSVNSLYERHVYMLYRVHKILESEHQIYVKIFLSYLIEYFQLLNKAKYYIRKKPVSKN